MTSTYDTDKDSNDYHVGYGQTTQGEPIQKKGNRVTREEDEKAPRTPALC